MTQKITFTKMHGLGNDFIVIDALTHTLDVAYYTDLALQLCDRHTGIGGDGIVFVLPSDKAHFKMRIINSDGSEPEMCGNGLRCFAQFVYQNKLINTPTFQVETLAGIKEPSVLENGLIKVDMGIPILERSQIPMLGTPKNTPVINMPITAHHSNFLMTGVNMGNPHAVIFVDDLKKIDLDTLGTKFEHHPLFPERINTEFVKIINKQEARMIVWERGAGKTLACGTGACAVLVAGVLTDKLERTATIHLPGGPLEINWDANTNHVIMTGPATHVFDGTIDL